jgi:hypothetical protein
MLVVARFVMEERPPLELSAIAVGASCIMYAHTLNLRIRRRMRPEGGCACPCHDDDDPTSD